MYFPQAQAQLKAAARETLERIRKDREGSPLRIKRLLAYVEAHLFDPDLRVKTLKQACGIRDNSISIQFNTVLGLPPSAYIEECRLETACRLLRHTELSVSQVAELVGYANLQVFSTAFVRWSGQRPTPYRKQFRLAPELWTTHNDSLMRGDHLRQALLGELQPVAAQTLIQRLQTIYNPPADDAAPAAILPRPQLGAGLNLFSREEIRQAHQAWQVLSPLPLAEQRRRLRRKMVTSSLVLFDLLIDRSREAAQVLPQRGVELAELGIACLYEVELENFFQAEPRYSPEFLANLKVRGWARLGEARRLVLDLAGAEKAFAIAERQLTCPRNRMLAAEIHHLKGSLRWHQQRLDKALALETRAIALLRQSGDPLKLAQALAMRALIYHAAGKPQAALCDLGEALPLALPLTDAREAPQLSLTIYYRMVSASLTAGLVSEANELLKPAFALAKKIGDALMIAGLHWLEGSLEHVRGNPNLAEAKLLQARDDFIELQKHGQAAIIALDLALLYSQAGRVSAAINLTAESLALIEGFPLPQRTLAAVRQLQEAVTRDQLPPELLEQARQSLSPLRQDPALAFALGVLQNLARHQNASAQRPSA